MRIFNSALVIIGLASSSFAGDLTGTVTYDGKAPKKKMLRMDSDPICGAAHKDAVYTESFIVDENGNFANVFVYLKNAKSDSVPSEAAVIDQNGCMYSPHVLGVQAGQELKILNSDQTMHNIHGLPKVNKQFNFGMPKTVKYVQVFDHPYFAVTGLDGKFTISGIPDGEYEVVAWQEKFGSKRIMTQSVSIGKDTQTLNFTFSRPKKK